MLSATWRAIRSGKYKIGALLGTVLSLLGTAAKVAEVLPVHDERLKVGINTAASVIGVLIAANSTKLIVPSVPPAQ
jgi:hypothetical protein